MRPGLKRPKEGYWSFEGIMQQLTGVFNQPSFSHLQRPHHPNILRTGLISMGAGPASQIYLWHGAVDPREAIRQAEASYNRILWSIGQRDTRATRDELAHLYYYLAIRTPFRRGSAAIAELVTEAVARSVGFQLRYHSCRFVVRIGANSLLLVGVLNS